MTDRLVVDVLVDGCFDPLHIGHFEYIQTAAWLSLNKKATVNVAPDAVIQAKGRQPFQFIEDRERCLRELPYVERTISMPLVDAITQIGPRYLVKGMDWHGKLPADVVGACALYGTSIVYTATCRQSSSQRLANMGMNRAV